MEATQCQTQTQTRQSMHVNIRYICLRFKKEEVMLQFDIIQELCESRGGRPGLSVLTSPGFHGRKAILNHAHALVSACP